MGGRVQKVFLKIISGGLVLAALAAQAQNGDADLKTEERFHRLYKQYNEKPTSEDAWEKVLSDRKPNTYSVQEKDTLWDISGTLFGDAHYWPKVWSLNTKDILNPHEINPKQVIKFYPGTMAEAPTVGLAQKSDAPEALPTHVLEKKQDGSLELEGVKIPPPRNKSRPVVKKLPKSLPLYRLGAVNTPPVDFEVSGARVKYEPAPKDLKSFVTDQPPVSVGEVVELELPEEQSTGEYTQIVVRVSDPGIKQYVAYTDEQRVSDPFELLASKATVVEVQGEIDIKEPVNAKENLFRALVKKVISPVEVGAKLMPGRIAQFNSGSSLVSSSVQARIIGGEYQRFGQNMFGMDSIVFLNAGAKEGLQEGSTLQIFMNEKIRKSHSVAVENDRVIGTVKLIKLADHFSTGFVLDSSTDVLVGDYAGGTAKASAGSSGSSDSSSSSGEEDLAL